MKIIYIVLLVVVSYLCGGVPYAYYVVKWRHDGADIRDHGSGNVGATNVYRCFGWTSAILSALGDIFKGTIPVLGAIWLSSFLGIEGHWRDAFMILIGLVAVLGHCYSWRLKGKGGKGIATSAGALLAITPWLIVAMIAIFVATVRRWDYVSLGSLVVAFCYPVSVAIFYWNKPVLVGLSFVLAILVFWRHRENISRLKQGTERKFSASRNKEERHA